MSSYKVGQILYVVPTKQTAVYPMQVIEEITKKSLNGVEIDYVLKAGGEDPKTILHREIKGEIFETADKAKMILTDRATKSVHRLVEAAYKKSLEWYPTTSVQPSQQQNEPIETQSSEHTITLEDGTVARIKLPDILKTE
jgi:hypothetical protein